MSDRLAIIGAGGHGREALGVARAADAVRPRWNDIVLYDDGVPDGELLARLDTALAGPVDAVIRDHLDHVIAIGDPTIRRRIADEIDETATAITLVDPTASLGDDVTLGAGAMVYPGAICTTNVRIGRHSHLNCRSVVSHDCRVGDFVSLSPGVLLNGNVTIEPGAFLGTGAIVLPGVRVGQDAVVGAGAVVIDDVPPGVTVVGVPAR